MIALEPGNYVVVKHPAYGRVTVRVGTVNSAGITGSVTAPADFVGVGVFGSWAEITRESPIPAVEICPVCRRSYQVSESRINGINGFCLRCGEHMIPVFSWWCNAHLGCEVTDCVAPGVDPEVQEWLVEALPQFLLAIEGGLHTYCQDGFADNAGGSRRR